MELSTTLEHVRILVAHHEVRISLHGYEASAEDNVKIRDVIEGVDTAVVVEDYPHYPKGRCCLVLRRDGHELPIHVVWGIPSSQKSPAVVVTAYRHDPEKWDETWQKRRT